MKNLIGFTLTLLFIKTSVAQDPTYAGRVLYDYSIINNGNTRVTPVLFLFQSDQYAQMFVYAGDNAREKLMDDLKRRKLENPNDSLKHQDIKKALDAADDVTKPQFSFGSLKTMFTTTKWIEPYSKQEYCVKDSVPAMTWELVDDTATISGLLCRKAIGSSIGNKYEAWYAPSIPVSVAPFQLRGLPGLLVEMTNLNNKRHLKLAALNWPYADGFPGNVCTLANAISRQNSDALFAKEDANAQKLLDQVRKAKELQNRE